MANKPPHKDKLSALAAERGMTVFELVKEALESEQSIEGAREKLAVRRNVIYYHLARNGCKIEMRLAVIKKDNP